MEAVCPGPLSRDFEPCAFSCAASTQAGTSSRTASSIPPATAFPVAQTTKALVGHPYPGPCSEVSSPLQTTCLATSCRDGQTDPSEAKAKLGPKLPQLQILKPSAPSLATTDKKIDPEK